MLTTVTHWRWASQAAASFMFDWNKAVWNETDFKVEMMQKTYSFSCLCSILSSAFARSNIYPRTGWVHFCLYLHSLAAAFDSQHSAVLSAAESSAASSNGGNRCCNAFLAIVWAVFDRMGCVAWSPDILYLSAVFWRLNKGVLLYKPYSVAPGYMPSEKGSQTKYQWWVVGVSTGESTALSTFILAY